MYIARNRKPQRLKNRDYSKNGYYFVTFCTRFFIRWFGQIEDDEMVLNQYGKIVEKQIKWMEINFQYVRIDEFIIMPNHVHLILVIFNPNARLCRDNPRVVPTQQEYIYNRRYNLISKTICALKTTSSKKIHENDQNIFKWQRSFYDRIIRNHDELNKIRNYIKTNPANWKQDRNNKPL